nr:CvpA family protein [Buchnera aphidicola]
MSRFNLILGGGIGILRGLFLSYLFLIIFSYFNYKKYTFYIKNSIFFSTFLHLINYWIDCS